jgi:hypothetical protein
MTLEEMELAQARLNLMIDFLKSRTIERTDPKVAADIATYQRWHDDLDAQIGLERVRRGSYQRRTRRPHEGAKRSTDQRRATAKCGRSLRPTQRDTF